MQGHKGYYQLKGEHLKKFLIFRILLSERNETFVLAALPPARPGAAPWKTSCLTWTQVFLPHICMETLQMFYLLWSALEIALLTTIDP